MKGLNLILAACFVIPAFDGAVANTIQTRTTRQTTPTTTTGARTQSTKSRIGVLPRATKTITSRNTNTEKSRVATTPRENSVTARTATTKTVLSRPRQTTTRTVRATGLSRAATTQTRDTVMQRDFGKCKTVFFDCMDEFCANKNAQLKRCACSTRATEFDATQKSLNNVEDKLLDFSQRLVQINMDPADAAVINRATDGENAYYATADKTASKRALDDIAKKLNSKFDSAENRIGNMSALSWSLDMDSAFDSVDSLSGIATTAKSGTALRNAALPICREMATEVCAPDDISLVENSYNMAIEQDCNTVKKAFETQAQQARSKILESSALLDMTRLNNYQENNSDDILTCKSKMLDMLENTNVCGTDLTKCLDISGRYINPTTGEAFLSPDLINLSNLIVRPTGTDSWAKTPANAQFVSYLNAKKIYLEPAMKNCQMISNDVWTAFVEDALAQIKIAQNAKLEQVRTSCTALLSDCLDNAKENLSQFDSRALSTFGVQSDKTINALCENVKTSCAKITQYVPDGNITSNDWETGVTGISARETYTTIINTCREVGRNCIINSCKSISGNFGLCENITSSVNRHSILTRAACWDDVLNCVSNAGDVAIQNIHNILPNYNTTSELYDMMYSDTSVYDICSDPTDTNHPCLDSIDSVDCYRCRIAEQIWGNCSDKPNNMVEQNHILIPTDPNATTLLSWFAKNTHTQYEANSCATSICPAGTLDYTLGTTTMCVDPSQIVQCPSENILCRQTITTPTATTNCCSSETFDTWSNCCANGGATINIYELFGGLTDSTITTTTAICTNNNNANHMTLLARFNDSGMTKYVFCSGDVISGTTGANPTINCSGNYVMLECDANACYYRTPGASDEYGINYFINANRDDDAYCPDNTNNKCTYNGTDWTNCPTTIGNGQWYIKF